MYSRMPFLDTIGEKGEQHTPACLPFRFPSVTLLWEPWAPAL